MKRALVPRLFTSKWFPIITGILIGATVFLGVFGLQVVIPTNVDWLLTGGDLSQHYIGWEFFRQSDWTFPIGVAADLAYPHGLAITFMDSLPLFAIPAKLFAGVLPEQFQYFGLWGLMSYILLGVLAGLIARRITHSPWIITLFIVFMSFSPLVFQRMFTHTALAGQWIILLAVYVAMKANTWRLRTVALAWSVVLSLSVLIHPYFLPMCLFVLVVSAVLRYTAIRKSAIEIGIPILSSFIMTWLIGGFTFTTISGERFGGAGFDVASFVLPNGWSVLGLGLPETRFEMFAYLGLGGVVLVCVALVAAFIHRLAVFRYIKKKRSRAIVLAIAMVLFVILAVGPTIKVAGAPIFSYEVPNAIEKIWGVFRVTARLAWPLWYGLLVGALFAIIKYVKPKTALTIIAAACVIQVIDVGMSPQLRSHHDKFKTVAQAEYKTELTDERWGALATGKRHIVYMGDLYDSHFVNIAQYAVEHRMTLNTGYFARKPTREIESTLQKARQDISTGMIDDETIYLYHKPFQVAGGMTQIQLNDYFVTVR